MVTNVRGAVAGRSQDATAGDSATSDDVWCLGSADVLRSRVGAGTDDPLGNVPASRTPRLSASLGNGDGAGAAYRLGFIQTRVRGSAVSAEHARVGMSQVTKIGVTAFARATSA
jgi:hypothetical protein